MGSNPMASTNNRSGTDASKLASVMPSRKGYREDCGTSYLLNGGLSIIGTAAVLKTVQPDKLWEFESLIRRQYATCPRRY